VPIPDNEPDEETDPDPVPDGWYSRTRDAVLAGVQAAGWVGNTNLFDTCLTDTPAPNATCLNAQAGDVFKDFGAQNYRLKPGSPAINKGPRVGPGAVATAGVDLDGKPRIIGSRIDLGCYEFPFLPGTLLLVR